MIRFTLICVCSFGYLTPAALADTLNQAMLKITPEILETLQKKKVRNVGVLKFLSAHGHGSLTDVGEINVTVAERLEMALILTGDLKDHVGVVRNASSVAAKTPGTNHTTAKGRQALFAAKYPLAWGSDEVRVDAFLTGVVRVQADESLRVLLHLLVPERKTEHLVTLEASPDVASLMEAGRSFRTRGLFENSSFETDENKTKVRQETVRKDAYDSAEKIRQDTAKYHPASRQANPEVIVTILYDGVPQTIEYAEGEARIAEPRPGQKVTFMIERKKDSIKGSLGVVLKINGENTIEQQWLRDPECRKWILDQENQYAIAGFLLAGNQKSSPFIVLSETQSQVAEFRYGHEVGTISWSVFRSFQTVKKDEPMEVNTYDENDTNALNRGLFPEKPPQTLAKLRRNLDTPSSSRDRSRGLIADDRSNIIDTPTPQVTFQADPVPILHASVRYYKK